MKLLRCPDVLALTAMGRSTHHRRIQDGLMTPGVRLGANSVAWPEAEIAAINAARIAGKSEADIRQLVADLIAARARTSQKI